MVSHLDRFGGRDRLDAAAGRRRERLDDFGGAGDDDPDLAVGGKGASDAHQNLVGREIAPYGVDDHGHGAT